jgi:hypothetical protein
VTVATEEEIRDLDRKVKQLRLDYERYFLGSRPREPVLLRSEVDKAVGYFSNTAIQNTALRFRFQSICSRYHALKRQWTETLRKIEQGTYSRHRFRADLHERERAGTDAAEAPPVASETDLFSEYREARRACGEDVQGLTRDKVERLLERQRAKLRERYGDAEFRFRVVVEDGRVKLKAARVR